MQLEAAVAMNEWTHFLFVCSFTFLHNNNDLRVRTWPIRTIVGLRAAHIAIDFVN